MYPKKFKLIIFILILFILLQSISINNASSSNNSISIHNILEGENWYTLFAPQYSTITYLLNYDKEVVHTWEGNYFPGHSAYLLENGNLLRTTELFNSVFLSGGLGGGVQEIDWNSTVIWNFVYSSDTYALHHDVAYLPNGNILMIAWELKNFIEAVDAGRNPDLVSPLFGLWPDHIIEVDPILPEGGNIVWEWHVWDHLIQDFDSSKDNYGVVEDHPELVDINYGVATGIGSDWLHTNSIYYNQDFDQILLSVRNFNEIWVIDHSTTTAEAASHTGGNSSKGGDLLYRWGNPRTYRRGTIDDQKLFGQHDARWIEPGFPGDGDILVFNNGFGRPGLRYSSVDEIIPPVDSNGHYNITPNSPYGPEEQVWIYTAKNPTDFYAYMISGAQRMSNGNTIICQGKKGLFFEVTYGKETVWEYLNPYPNQPINSVFKIESYPSDYPGLVKIMEQPENPEKPTGTMNGIIGFKYKFSSRTIDPQENKIYYLFDWGDNTNSDWIGPFNSGEIVNTDHTWNKRGDFNIKVKAKDIYNYESSWSDSLTVTMIRDKTLNSNFKLLQFLFSRFSIVPPILTQLLKL